MIRYIRSLWLGELPLSRVVFIDMLAIGTLVNFAATVVALLTFVAGVPVAIGVVIHSAPVPYNILLFMAVWQSAVRTASHWSWPAQLVAVLWVVGAFIF